MKYLLIAMVLGALGFYVFVYEAPEQREQSTEQSKEDKLREEFGVEETSYQGAITETYNKYKKNISDAKDAVTKTENRNQ